MLTKGLFIGRKVGSSVLHRHASSVIIKGPHYDEIKGLIDRARVAQEAISGYR